MKGRVISRLILVGTLGAAIAWLALHRELLNGAAVQTTVRQFGPVAPIFFILLYALGTVLFVPGSAPTVAGGARIPTSSWTAGRPRRHNSCDRIRHLATRAAPMSDICELCGCSVSRKLLRCRAGTAVVHRECANGHAQHRVTSDPKLPAEHSGNQAATTPFVAIEPCDCRSQV